jgi:hypothetical protein
VVSDREEVLRALEGGPLAGREVRALTTEWGVVLAIDMVSAELRELWGAARELVPKLGRWPVAAMSWWNRPVDEGVFARISYGDRDSSPQAICERAERIDGKQALAPWLFDGEQYYARHWDKLVAFHLQQSEWRRGAAPTPEELGAAELRPDHVELERRLLAWEEARQPSELPERGLHLDWFDAGECSLLLLPTDRGEEAPAWLSFYGAEGEGGHERLIALLRSWRERYGAELVANWGTMLQLTVSAPPQTLDEAFELAVEQWATATHTVAQGTIRDHARALVGRQEWFLHSRP